MGVNAIAAVNLRHQLNQGYRRRAALLEEELDKKGQFKKQELLSLGVHVIYKLPTLFTVTGRIDLAHRVLDIIEKDYMLSNGDFKCVGRQPAPTEVDVTHDVLWPIVTGWVTMEAQRLGRAKDVGEGIMSIVNMQTNPAQYILLRRNGVTGWLITQFPEDQRLAPYYCIKRGENSDVGRLHLYSVVFLLFLQRATGVDRYARTADTLLKWLLNCNQFLLSTRALFSICQAFSTGLRSEKMVNQHMYKTYINTVINLDAKPTEMQSAECLGRVIEDALQLCQLTDHAFVSL